MSNKRLSVLSALILRFVLICLACAALADAQTTINVPADQPTIQSAINVANNGDTVVVAPGTYIENLDFLAKAITVTSSDGPAVTIVDGNAAGPVVTFKTNEGLSSVLNGFTLQNGVPAQFFPVSGVSGGGILILSASPTITNNVITHNRAICGIGIELQGGSAVIRGNTITGNTQDFGSGGCGGGGIEISSAASPPLATPQIIGNTITANTLPHGGFGGGISVVRASPVIKNNYISGNSILMGAGISLQSGGAPVIAQNIIFNNSTVAGGSAGGMYVQGTSESAAVVINNTIVGNTASDGSSGIYADILAPILISNNIVAASLGQTAVVCQPSDSIFPTFSHNDVTSPGGGQAWSSNCASFASSNGNISADPLFADATNNDYHLLSGSPAIDAGDNSAPSLPQQDYDGKTRLVDGNNDCVDAVDLGAYELQATVGASFSPASLLFPDQHLNTTSSPQAVTLSSTGTTCLKIAAVPVTGDFAQSNTCGSSLPAGQSCVMNVTFTPSVLGTRTGTLSLTGNQNGPAPTVSLSGTGVAFPVASVSPASISFGNVFVGTQNSTPTVTVSNTGDAPLNVNSLTISGDSDFFVSVNNCSGVVAPGGSCTIQMEFHPLSAGPGSATLTIGSNASNGPVSVALSGTGVSPATASVSPSALTFGNQAVGTQSPAQSVAVTDTGTGPLHISSLAISGDADFTILSSNCPIGAGISPGATCFIDVAFAPRSLGPGSATLTIISDAGNNPVSVALSGTGVNPPKASISPASLNFGSLLPGTESAPQTVTVSNIGGAALLINSQLVTGDSDFFISNSNCVGGPGVAPGSSCSIQVVFFPHSGGPGSATLTITSNDPAAPQQSVSLTGTGIDYAVSAPASLSVRSGDKVQPTITVSAVGGNFSNAVALSCSGLPTGASCSFSPASVVPGAGSASSRLTLNTQQSGGIKTPVGTYTITVNGTSGSSAHSALIKLTVTN